MSCRNIFKKNTSILSKYSVSELEALKSIYEKQLEEMRHFDFDEGPDVSWASNICVSSFDGTGHIKNQIKKDLTNVLAELARRKSESGYEKEA